MEFRWSHLVGKPLVARTRKRIISAFVLILERVVDVKTMYSFEIQLYFFSWDTVVIVNHSAGDVTILRHGAPPEVGTANFCRCAICGTMRGKGDEPRLP